MRLNLAVRLTLALATLGAVVGGCSSAPSPDENARQKNDSLLDFPGGPPVVDYCAYLPNLRTQPPNATSYDANLDCYNHVIGYDVRVPTSVQNCPWLDVPSLYASWAPQSAAPSAASLVAVPSWGLDALSSAKVCRYLFKDITTDYDGSLFPTSDSVGQAQEQALAESLCSSMTAAGVPYLDVRYLLPAYVESSNVGPFGLPLNPGIQQFSQAQMCVPYGLQGGCDTCAY